MANRRIARLNEAIRTELADLILRQMKDPRLAGLISITSVETAPDLRHARVFVSVMGTEGERSGSLRALESAAGFLRSQLSDRLMMRQVPNLHFVPDESIARGERLMELFRRVQHPEASAEPETPENPE